MGKRNVWIAMLVLCSACKGVDESQSLGDVSQQGPFAIGTMESSYSGSDGVEIPVQVWYPSMDTTGVTVTYDELIPGEAWESAQPACGTVRPVVLFSHGNTGIRWQSPFLMDFLASHGFVVAAMDHVTNTFLDQDSSRFPHHVLDRPRQVEETFDWLISDGAGVETRLEGCVDPNDGYAVMGHSFGGYTTFMSSGATIPLAPIQAACDGGQAGACELVSIWLADHPNTTDIDIGDDRVWGAVTLAPWDAGGLLNEGMASLKPPVLTLTGTEDETTPLSMVDALVASMGAHPNHYGKMADTGHFSFAPISCQLLGGDGCGADNLDLEIVKQLTSASTAAFLADLQGWEGASEQFPVTSEHLTWD